MKKEFVDYNDLRKLGFGENQARRIIRITKQTLVKAGYGFYNGRRVGLVPYTAVCKILARPDKEGDRNANN